MSARSKSPSNRRAVAAAAPSGPRTAGNKYSVLLPTYNERENLPLITYMLDKVFVDKCVHRGV
jgi:hypothetical protein